MRALLTLLILVVLVSAVNYWNMKELLLSIMCFTLPELGQTHKEKKKKNSGVSKIAELFPKSAFRLKCLSSLHHHHFLSL